MMTADLTLRGQVQVVLNEMVVARANLLVRLLPETKSLMVFLECEVALHSNHRAE
jgi:hypothetical protein